MIKRYKNKKMDNRGYIQLYTGDGKGKTTAAIGLAVRAAGAGRKVFIAQFVKGMHYSELDALKRFPEIEVRQYGLDCFIKQQPSNKDIEAAKRGLQESISVIKNNEHDVVILDEACIAVFYKLFDVDELITVLKGKPDNMEVVLTGRKASQELYDISDLVTEMKEVKHYYQKGVQARKGIEH